MATPSTTDLVELLKYPVLVFSIVLALVILKYAMHLEIGMLTEVSTDGLKFSAESNKATLEAITELESRLGDLTVRVNTLEKVETPADGVTRQATKLQAISATQTVSDATATIARLTPKLPGDADEQLVGWMWIGNYRRSWDKPTLAALDTGQPIAMAPQDIVIGSEFRALGNMVVRDGMPENDDDYYRGRKSLGVIPRGGRVRALSRAEGIDREFAVQYWLKVQYLGNDEG